MKTKNTSLKGRLLISIAACWGIVLPTLVISYYKEFLPHLPEKYDALANIIWLFLVYLSCATLVINTALTLRNHQ